MLSKYLQEFEERLKQDNRPFLLGQELSAADLLVWPWFERLEAGTTAFPALKELVSKEKYPTIFAWIDRMLTVDAVKQCALTTENHLKFMKSVKGEHDYDVLGRDYDLYVSNSE